MKSNKIHYPHVIIETKKEVWFYISSGYPTTMIVGVLMKKYFPEDWKGYIASKEKFKILTRKYKEY